MTLLIWGVNHRMAWVAADNRYYVNSKTKFDNAKKIFEIEATNARGLIGYAGVGAKVKPDGTLFEISSWLENLLEGQSFTLEWAFGRIRDAAVKRRFGDLSGSAHSFVFAGYHEEKPLCIVLMSKPKTGVATITKFDPKTGKVHLHKIDADYKPILHSPTRGQTIGGRIGSGAQFITNREVLQTARIVSSCKVDHMAARRAQAYIAYNIREASKKEGNNTVGPECFFAVRYAKSGGFHDWNPKSSPNYPAGILPGVSKGWKNTVFHGILLGTLMKPMLENSEKMFSDMPEDKAEMEKLNKEAAKEATRRINNVKPNPSDRF